MPETIAAVTDDRFAADVLEAGEPVLVDFTAAWCPPCRVMKPVLEELAAARDDLRVVTLDVDEHPRVAARYGVLSMPTFILFRDGQPVWSASHFRVTEGRVREAMAAANPDATEPNAASG